MIDCIEKYMKNWKRNGWKLADGNPVKNKEDLVELDEACSKISVTWVSFKVLNFFECTVVFLKI